MDPRVFTFLVLGLQACISITRLSVSSILYLSELWVCVFVRLALYQLNYATRPKGEEAQKVLNRMSGSAFLVFKRWPGEVDEG